MAEAFAFVLVLVFNVPVVISGYDDEPDCRRAVEYINLGQRAYEKVQRAYCVPTAEYFRQLCANKRARGEECE